MHYFALFITCLEISIFPSTASLNCFAENHRSLGDARERNVCPTRMAECVSMLALHVGCMRAHMNRQVQNRVFVQSVVLKTKSMRTASQTWDTLIMFFPLRVSRLNQFPITSMSHIDTPFGVRLVLALLAHLQIPSLRHVFRPPPPPIFF